MTLLLRIATVVGFAVLGTILFVLLAAFVDLLLPPKDQGFPRSRRRFR